MNSFRLAQLSLTRHRFTTLISVFAIALSVACAGILLRLHQISESRFSIMGQGGDAIVGAKAGGIEILLNALNGEGKYPDFLPYKLFESLKAEQAVKFEDGAVSQPSYIESITPIVYFGKYNQYRVIGTDESFYKIATGSSPLQFNEGQWVRAAGEVVVGSNVARINNLKIGDEISIRPWISDEEIPNQFKLKVVGILSPTESVWDRNLYSTVEQAQLVFGQNQASINKKSIWGNGVLHFFFIKLKQSGFAPLEALVNKRTVGQVVRVIEQKERLKELSGVGKSIGIFVTAFVIILSGLTVAAMLVTRFEGMSVQLAVLHAIGYTKKEIAKWLMWEGILLSVMGIILGALIDALGLPILRTLLGTALPPSDLIGSSVFESYLVWLIAFIATIISVTIPMLRMSRQNTHDALKGL